MLASDDIPFFIEVLHFFAQCFSVMFQVLGNDPSLHVSPPFPRFPLRFSLRPWHPIGSHLTRSELRGILQDILRKGLRDENLTVRSRSSPLERDDPFGTVDFGHCIF